MHMFTTLPSCIHSHTVLQWSQNNSVTADKLCHQTVLKRPTNWLVELIIKTALFWGDNKKLNKTAAFLVNNLAADNDNNKHAYITKEKWINRRWLTTKLNVWSNLMHKTKVRILLKHIIGLINKCMCIMITSDFKLL